MTNRFPILVYGFWAGAAALLLHLVTYDLGMGQDECAITLTALRNIEWGLSPEYNFYKILKAALGYSRGGLSIIWDSTVVGVASLLGLQLTTLVTNLPSIIPISLAALSLYGIGRRLQKSPWVSLIAAFLFLLSPGILGYLRTLPLHAALSIGIRALIIWTVLNKKKPSLLLHCSVAALFHIDNGAVFTVSQLFGFALIVRYVQGSGIGFPAFIKVIKDLVWTRYTLIPIGSIVGLYLIFRWHIGSGGIIAHNIANIGVGLYFHPNYFSAIAVQVGWGLAAFALLALFMNLKASRPSGEALGFGFLLLTTFVFICLRNWGDAQNYVPFLIFPLAGLVLCLHDGKRWFVLAGTAAVGLNAALCVYYIHGPVPARPRFYGEIALHRQINSIKAAGYILREQGLNPLEQRRIAPHLRPVAIIDGEPSQDKPFFAAIYYFGTAPRNVISPATRVIYEYDHIYWKAEVRALLGEADKFKGEGFALAHRLQRNGIDVAWLYERCLPACGPAQVHDVNRLVQAWDEKYASRSQIMTVDWTVP